MKSAWDSILFWGTVSLFVIASMFALAVWVVACEFTGFDMPLGIAVATSAMFGAVTSLFAWVTG